MDILDFSETRRNFLIKSGGFLGLAALGGPALLPGCRPQAESAVAVTATEDLMREHGVLQRLLLIFEDLEGKLRQGVKFAPELLVGPPPRKRGV